MAWTTPLTAVSGATFTAAQFNATVRDNLLETAPAKATTSGRFFASTGANSIAERIPNSSTVSASSTTSATSYGGLADAAGPTLAVTSGTAALISWGAFHTNDTTGANSFSAYAITAGTTTAAADNWAAGQAVSGAARVLGCSRVHLNTTLTAGSNTYQVQYRVSGGIGTFSSRHIAVVPF